MVYATEETPLGTAGSVRNAIDELDERFLVISGDVLTDLDLTAIVKAHEEKEALATIGAGPGGEPARVRHRHHPRRRLDRAVPREAVVGPGVQRHDQHRASSCSSRRSSTTSSPTRSVDFSSEVFPALLADGKPLFGADRRGLLGGRRHPRELPLGPQGHPRRAGARGDPRLRDGRRRPRGGGGRDPPRRHRRGPGRHRRELPHRGRRAARALHGARHQRPGAGQRRPRAGRRARQLLPRRERAAARRHHRPLVRPPRRRARRGGRGARRRVLRRRARGARQRREGVPVQDRRAGRGHQLLDRVGEPRVPVAVRPGGRGRPRQRRHHPRAGHPGGDGLRHHPEEGQHDRHLARLEPVGPDAQAGDDGRAPTPRASTSSTSRWPRCRSPGSSSGARSTPGASRSASSRETRRAA